MKLGRKRDVQECTHNLRWVEITATQGHGHVVAQQGVPPVTLQIGNCEWMGWESQKNVLLLLAAGMW